jgi:hypothetical protein
MGSLRNIRPEQIIVATFSRHAEALTWGRDRLVERLGPVALVSPVFTFDQTTYYEASMGTGLQKQFWTFAHLVPPDCLPTLKTLTNTLEAQLAGSGTYPEERPLNLDPGLLSLGKLVLATTKDQAHRIYLRDGIFAEVTLQYRAGAFHPWPWTYADYRLPVVGEFLLQARADYQNRLAAFQTGEAQVDAVAAP